MSSIWKRTVFLIKSVPGTQQVGKGRGRPVINWIVTMSKDFEVIERTWEEAKEAAKDRKIWRSCVA